MSDPKILADAKCPDCGHDKKIHADVPGSPWCVAKGCKCWGAFPLLKFDVNLTVTTECSFLDVEAYSEIEARLIAIQKAEIGENHNLSPHVSAVIDDIGQADSTK